MKTVYQANDGTIFVDEKECITYEKRKKYLCYKDDGSMLDDDNLFNADVVIINNYHELYDFITDAKSWGFKIDYYKLEEIDSLDSAQDHFLDPCMFFWNIDTGSFVHLRRFYIDMLSNRNAAWRKHFYF